MQGVGMRPVRTRMAWLVCALSLVVVSCGRPDGPAEPQAPPDELTVGWTAVGDVPWDPAFTSHAGFWSGSEVIVAGGRWMSEDETEVRFARESYAFSPETLRWRQLAPLPLDGFDGLIGLTGTLTPQGWVGLGYPCTNGGIVVEGSASEQCSATPLLFGYSDAAGWTVSGLASAAAALFADQPPARALDVLGLDSAGQLLVAHSAGLIRLGAAPTALTASPVARWADLGVEALQAACRVGDTVLAVTADQAPGLPPPGGGEISDSAITLITVGLTAGLAIATSSAALGETVYYPETQCLPDRGLLYSPSPLVLGDRLRLITPTGSTDWGEPRVQNPNGVPIAGQLVDAQAQLLRFHPNGGQVLDAASGRVIGPLSATPAFEFEVWTGSLLLAVTNTSDRVFALLPDLPGWSVAGASLLLSR